MEKMIKEILELDEKISGGILLPEKSRFLRTAAAVFAHSGDSWFWLAGLFIVWVFSNGDLHRHAALLATAILFQAFLVLGIKFLIKRRRPEGEWGAIYRNTDPHSFPSGHAVRGIMLAVLIWGLGFPYLGLALLFWALFVSLARVMLGLHYLVDITAGWFLGILLAVFFLEIQLFLYRIFPFVF
jgi:membrane-associated phospholipid phosphatase